MRKRTGTFCGYRDTNLTYAVFPMEDFLDIFDTVLIEKGRTGLRGAAAYRDDLLIPRHPSLLLPIDLRKWISFR